MENIHPNDYLSKSDINLLGLKGFIKDNSKNSGYYYIEDNGKTIVLIPYEYGKYKLEFYEMCYESDGTYYEDFYKRFNKEEQSLEDFINLWVD